MSLFCQIGGLKIYEVNTRLKEILNNLKSTKLNKNNMVISKEDVQKIKNYTDERNKITLYLVNNIK